MVILTTTGKFHYSHLLLRSVAYEDCHCQGLESAGDDFRNLFFHPSDNIASARWNHPDSFTVLMKVRSALRSDNLTC